MQYIQTYKKFKTWGGYNVSWRRYDAASYFGSVEQQHHRSGLPIDSKFWTTVYSDCGLCTEVLTIVGLNLHESRSKPEMLMRPIDYLRVARRSRNKARIILALYKPRHLNHALPLVTE
jgi:hypothetical protein